MKVHIEKKLTPQEKEIREMKETLIELQEREKQRDESYKPKYDLAKNGE